MDNTLNKTEAKLLARLRASYHGVAAAEGKRQFVAAQSLAAKGLITITSAQVERVRGRKPGTWLREFYYCAEYTGASL